MSAATLAPGSKRGELRTDWTVIFATTLFSNLIPDEATRHADDYLGEQRTGKDRSNAGASHLDAAARNRISRRPSAHVSKLSCVNPRCSPDASCPLDHRLCEDESVFEQVAPHIRLHLGQPWSDHQRCQRLWASLWLSRWR